MQMMYGTIYNALVEAGLDDRFSPQDYLNFFCLGNREMVDGNNETNQSNENTPQVESCYHVYSYYHWVVNWDVVVVIGIMSKEQKIYDICAFKGDGYWWRVCGNWIRKHKPKINGRHERHGDCNGSLSASTDMGKTTVWSSWSGSNPPLKYYYMISSYFII